MPTGIKNFGGRPAVLRTGTEDARDSSDIFALTDLFKEKPGLHAACRRTVQLDYDEIEEPWSAVHGTTPIQLEVHRTVKRADTWALRGFGQVGCASDQLYTHLES